MAFFVSLWDGEKVLEIGSGDGYMTLWMLFNATEQYT